MTQYSRAVNVVQNGVVVTVSGAYYPNDPTSDPVVSAVIMGSPHGSPSTQPPAVSAAYNAGYAQGLKSGNRMGLYGNTSGNCQEVVPNVNVSYDVPQEYIGDTDYATRWMDGWLCGCRPDQPSQQLTGRRAMSNNKNSAGSDLITIIAAAIITTPATHQ
ncbi:MAG: hypothetical protein ACLPKE_22770 [Streptosporangiaceae bacterium]